MDTEVKELEEKLKAINQSFSPSAPIEQRDLFFGRLNQLSDIEDTISEKGLHCVLYGERGVGKTSLAIQNTHQQVRQEFQNAIITSKEVGHFENVLYAIAGCGKDEFDSSTANEIVGEFNKITGLNVTRESLTYHLGTLCKPERGEILVKVGGSKNIKYKFRSPMFKNFVQLNWYKKQLPK